MNNKRQIERTCIVCRAKRDKKDLIRIVHDKTGMIDVDNDGHKSGRGCYVCKKLECINQIKKSKALNRTYKTNVSEDVYDRILQSIVAIQG